MGLAVNSETPNAQLEARGDLLKRGLSTFAAGETVGDNADVVAALGLSVGEIQDVTEDTTDRGANRVQDAKRLI